MGVQRERYEGGRSRSSIPRYVLGVLGGTDFPEHGGEEFEVAKVTFGEECRGRSAGVFVVVVWSLSSVLVTAWSSSSALVIVVAIVSAVVVADAVARGEYKTLLLV